jgi:hypothetical protein
MTGLTPASTLTCQLPILLHQIRTRCIENGANRNPFKHCALRAVSNTDLCRSVSGHLAPLGVGEAAKNVAEGDSLVCASRGTVRRGEETLRSPAHSRVLEPQRHLCTSARVATTLSACHSGRLSLYFKPALVTNPEHSISRALIDSCVDMPPTLRRAQSARNRSSIYSRPVSGRMACCKAAVAEVPDTLKSVQDYYGKVLSTSKDLKTSACTAAGRPDPLIRGIMSEIPEEVLSKFYGCGAPLPTGIDGLRVLDLGSGSGRDCYIASKLVGPTGAPTLPTFCKDNATYDRLNNFLV